VFLANVSVQQRRHQHRSIAITDTRTALLRVGWRNELTGSASETQIHSYGARRQAGWEVFSIPIRDIGA
jgi:hypothetical protein